MSDLCYREELRAQIILQPAKAGPSLCDTSMHNSRDAFVHFGQDDLEDERRNTLQEASQPAACSLGECGNIHILNIISYEVLTLQGVYQDGSA